MESIVDSIEVLSNVEEDDEKENDDENDDDVLFWNRRYRELSFSTAKTGGLESGGGER